MKPAAQAVFKYYDNGETTFPAIPLYVSRKPSDDQIKLHALIDSGAMISILKEDVAKALGIVIEQGKEIYLGGVGGRIKGFIHDVHFEVAGKKFMCPVVFSREYLVSLNLLGREGFFEQFAITFEERRKRVMLS